MLEEGKVLSLPFNFLNEKVKNDHLFGYAKKQQEQQQKAMAQMFTSMQQQQ